MKKKKKISRSHVLPGKVVCRTLVNITERARYLLDYSKQNKELIYHSWSRAEVLPN